MPTGVYVAEIVKGGTEEAGITKGNVITALNGTTVNSMEELQKKSWDTMRVVKRYL